MPIEDHEREQDATQDWRPQEPGGQPEHQERDAPDQPEPPTPEEDEEPIVPPAGRPRPPE